MSELKAYIGPHPTDHTLTDYYLKSEADKVIAHNKYKRCLAMVKWCKAEAEINHNSAYEASEYLPSREDYFRRRAEHYERWQKRWLELAEQFKDKEEAK